MTDAQIQTYLPPLATLIVISLGFLFSNSRLSDLATGVHKRIDDINHRMNDVNHRIDRLEAQYGRLESVIVGKLDEIEARLSRLEGRR